MTTTDRWSPSQYNRFRDERLQPFFDLVEMVQPLEGMRAVDLGCGTGEITAMLAERLAGSRVLGIDSSPAMLGEAAARASESVTFRQEDITAFDGWGEVDLVFSNAALQWVPANRALLPRILAGLPAGAQLAVQVPKNEGHPSHRIAEELARESPFRELLGGYVRRSEALSLEEYAQILYDHGAAEQVCIEKIYGHTLSHTLDVIEWVKGTMLSAYLSRLDGAGQELFLNAYRTRLLEELGERAPYFYPFRRLLFWGRKA